MSRITDLTAVGTLHTDDLLVDVDVHDTTMAATGTDKKLTIAQLGTGLSTLAAIPYHAVSTPAGSAITGTLADAGPTYTVPANEPAAGVAYEIKCVMQITATGTATDDTFTTAIYWGGIAGTALVSNISTNANGAIWGGTTYVECTGYVRFSSTTACAAYLKSEGEILGIGSSGGGFNPSIGANAATSTGLTTTSTKVLTVGLTISPTTGTPSVTPILAFARRVV